MAHHVMTRAAAARTGLFAGYRAPDGSFDETFAEGGEPRPALAEGRRGARSPWARASWRTAGSRRAA